MINAAFSLPSNTESYLYQKFVINVDVYAHLLDEEAFIYAYHKLIRY